MPTRPRTPRLSLSIALLPGLLLMGLAWASHAAAAPSLSPAALTTIIERLNAPALADREAASQRLVETEVSFDAIRRAGIDLTKLSAEQRSRLDAALFQRFRTTPRAGLGVRFDPGFPTGVRLQSIVPTFPASAVLRPGDVIERVDGARLVGAASQQGWVIMRQRILSFDPGQKMTMLVRRKGQTLTVDVPLGSYANLGNAAPVSDADLAAAWSFRRDRLGFSLRDPARLRPSATGLPWDRLTPLDESRLTPDLALVAGGLAGARPARRLDEIVLAQRRNAVRSAVVIQRGAAQRVIRIAPADRARPATPKQQLLWQIQQWESIRTQARLRAIDPALNDLERARWAAQIGRAEQQLTILQQRLAAVDNP